MFGKQSKRGKGFAILLAACLTVVATVTVYSLRDSLFTDREPDTSTPPTTTTSTTREEKPVVEPVTNVPDDRTTVSTEPTEPPAPLFVLPVSNIVSAKFSKEPVLSATMGDWRTHNGVDFAADAGARVMAISDGEVLAVTEDALWGSLIRIRHGEFVATYCGVIPEEGLAVKDTVKAGERIGTLGIVPCELMDGSHLHLEVMREQSYLDPLSVIDKEVKFQ